MSSRSLALVALALVSFAAACPFDFVNAEHCAANGGDASCRDADENTPYCALDGCGLYDESVNRTGCVAELPEQASCYSPCGGERDAAEDGSCLDGTGSSGSTTTNSTPPSTTDPSSDSTDPMGCDCDADAPICIDDTCVACEDDAFCGEQFGEERALCELNDCVACRPELAEIGVRHQGCDFDLLNCGPDGTCFASCLFPDDCEATACDAREGICGPRDRVFFVATDGDDASATGSEGEPFETIQRAVDAIGAQSDAQPFSVGTVMLGPGTYEESVTIAARTVLLRARDPKSPPTITAPVADVDGVQVPAIAMLGSNEGGSGNARLNVVGVRFDDSPGFAIRVGPSARLFADDVEMLRNGGAIEIDGGGGFLRNSIVAESAAGPAFVFSATGELAFVSSTLLQNTADPLLFDCAMGGGESILSIRDSVAGTYAAGADFATMVAEGCTIVDGGPLRSVVGELPSTSFRVDYRIEATPDDSLIIEEDVGLCEAGTPIDPEGFLKPCPPLRDIAGRPRDGVNYAGASVP